MTEFKGLSEVACDAIIAKLQGAAPLTNGGWAARAAAINAADTQGIQIAAPGVGDYFVGRVSQIAMTPAVFVLAGPTEFREQGAHSMTVKMQITIAIIEEAQTGPLLARRLERQARAIIECLYDDAPQEQAYIAGQAVVMGPYRLFPLRVIPGAALQPSGQETWRGMYEIVFTAEQEEI